jgi:diguanylate cyclase (GGDEF)-like protein
MLDIDTFKRVNDRYGHDAGDAVLQEIALVIRAAVRAEDIVARYGGEEFCILLPEIPPEEAERVAERLRAMIERRLLPAAAGVRSVTVSVGLALLRPSDAGAELFTRADHAMYAVKHVGGNRVCVPDGTAYRFYGELSRAPQGDEEPGSAVLG